MSRTLSLLLFFGLLGQQTYAQKKVLIPHESITPFYNLEEWIFSNAGWSYDSYDLTSFDPFSKYSVNTLEKAPMLFIDEHKYHDSWLSQDLFDFPDITLNLIDSVVINQNSSFKNGYHAPNGSIHIYTKKSPHNKVQNEFGLINQINDPGPLDQDPDKGTVNIERIKSISRTNIFLPDFFSTKFLSTNSSYTRTNRIIYDREFNSYLPKRTSGVARNRETDLLLSNRFILNNFDIRLLNSFNYKNTYYLWSPLAGIEMPAEHKKLQTSLLLSPTKKSYFKQSHLSFSFATTDSLQGASIHNYGLDEIKLSHSSSFLLPINESTISVYVNNTFYNWSDGITGNKKSLNDVNLIIGYNQDEIGMLNLVGGNHTLGFEYQKKLRKTLSLNISSYMKNLNGNGYSYALWNQRLGYTRLNRDNHSVTNNSNFVNTYSIAEVSSSFSRKPYQINWSLFYKHYWKFVLTDIDYSFKESELQLDSDIIYTNEKNVGFIGFNLFTLVNPSDKILLKSSVSGHLYRYGNELFTDNTRNINRLILSHSVQYRADKNAIIEILFKYLSSKNIVEFESLESNPIFTTADVRPIYLLNATAKTWLFNRSLGLTLALRNLLNSTESYNTNGQYYNMSISVTASLAIGKKHE